jgi:hypothetical protein
VKPKAPARIFSNFLSILIASEESSLADSKPKGNQKHSIQGCFLVFVKSMFSLSGTLIDQLLQGVSNLISLASRMCHGHPKHILSRASRPVYTGIEEDRSGTQLAQSGLLFVIETTIMKTTGGCLLFFSERRGEGMKEPFE